MQFKFQSNFACNIQNCKNCLLFQNFPFDHQVCRVEVNFIFPSAQFTLSALEPMVLDKLMLTNFSTLSDLWEFVGSNITMIDNDARFSAIYYHLKFKRRPQYYTGSIFVPMFLLLSLQISGLLIDPEEPGDRSAYSITIVLAFQFSQEQFTRNIPQTSQTVLLVVYVQFTTILSAMIAFYILLAGVLVNLKMFQKTISKQFKWRAIRVADFTVTVAIIFIMIVASAIFYSQVVS